MKIDIEPMFTRMRAVAVESGDASLCGAVEHFAHDLERFLREPAEIDAPTMAAVHVAFCLNWFFKTGEDVFNPYAAEDFARLWEAALALHRPRGHDAALH